MEYRNVKNVLANSIKFCNFAPWNDGCEPCSAPHFRGMM